MSSNDANTRTYPSMIHWRSETVAFSLRWIVGSAMLTTVLSSIAIARAKHIVSRTMTFSRAFSPLNPNSGIAGVLSGFDPDRNDPRRLGLFPRSASSTAGSRAA